mmetsp:Transcript_123812/g.396347  ORF Transcript_123812/g.396347 Transcript_123812/m.396347 type:complete len:264 (-) Transcript_123812:352-1143(-)
MVTTDLPTAKHFNASGFIDELCPLINFVHNSREHCSDYPSWSFRNTRPQYSAAGFDGPKLWWYQSCMSEGCSLGINLTGGCNHSSEHWPCQSGWPSYMIDAPAVMNRAMSWLSYLYDVTGELYWRANFVDNCNRDDAICSRFFPEPGPWGMDSWRSQLAQGGNGDGQLTYPGRPEVIGGKSVVPIASLRLKQIRDGLEDLEYLYALEDIAGREAALSFVRQLATNTFTYMRNVSLVMDVRMRLGDAIEVATKGFGSSATEWVL